MIAAGYTHSLFLKNDGSLWGMGYNGDGELGDGTYTTTNRPEQIVAGNVTAIAGGREHSLFLKDDGSLWAWAQTATASWATALSRPPISQSRSWPAMSRRLPPVLTTACFSRATAACGPWGGNQYGQLGDGTYATAPYFGTNQPEQIVAGNVTAIAAVFSYSLFLKGDGSLWAMGYNFYGQLGDGTYNNTNLPETDCGCSNRRRCAGVADSIVRDKCGFDLAAGGRRLCLAENGQSRSARFVDDAHKCAVRRGFTMCGYKSGFVRRHILPSCRRQLAGQRPCKVTTVKRRSFRDVLCLHPARPVGLGGDKSCHPAVIP